jgi:hypothetical protein
MLHDGKAHRRCVGGEMSLVRYLWHAWGVCLCWFIDNHDWKFTGDDLQLKCNTCGKVYFK